MWFQFWCLAAVPSPSFRHQEVTQVFTLSQEKSCTLKTTVFVCTRYLWPDHVHEHATPRKEKIFVNEVTESDQLYQIFMEIWSLRFWVFFRCLNEKITFVILCTLPNILYLLLLFEFKHYINMFANTVTLYIFIQKQYV